MPQMQLTGLRSSWSWLFGDHKSGVMNAWWLASFSYCAWHLFRHFRPGSWCTNNHCRGLEEIHFSQYLVCDRPSWLSVSSLSQPHCLQCVCTSACHHLASGPYFVFLTTYSVLYSVHFYQEIKLVVWMKVQH